MAAKCIGSTARAANCIVKAANAAGGAARSESSRMWSPRRDRVRGRRSKLVFLGLADEPSPALYDRKMLLATASSAFVAPPVGTESMFAVAGPSDYTGVDMQCVSEFNWNQGEEATTPLGGPYQSATGYFLSKGANVVMQDDPHPICAGGWSAKDDTLTLKATKQPRMFLKEPGEGFDKLIMLDMKSESISWTQNVANLGRQFNGALYTTWVRPQDENEPDVAAKLCTPRAAAASALCVPRRPARPVPKLTSLASGRGSGPVHRLRPPLRGRRATDGE